TALVENYYRIFLKRGPDAGGRAFWVARLRAGVAEEQVLAGLLTSPEYQQLHPGDEDFVRALYRDVLGREAETEGLAFWLGHLRNGVNRSTVALGVIRSGSAPPQGHIDSPTSSHMRPRAAEVAEQVGVRATGLLQSVGQYSEACGVKFSRRQGTLFVGGCG